MRSQSDQNNGRHKITNSVGDLVPSKVSKEQKRFAVSQAILEIIDQSGIAGLSHSKISRQAKVSRAWIYEYMGKDRSALVEAAADTFGRFFSRSDKSDFPVTVAELMSRLAEGTEFAFQCAVSYPVIIKIYYRFRGTSTPLGKVIGKYEKHFVSFYARCFREIVGRSEGAAQNKARTLLVLRLGFSHQIATSSSQAQALSEGRAALEVFLRG